MTNKLFQGGVPTEMDVIAIGRKWPEMKVGDTVPYADIEALIHVNRRSHRFRTVTTAWRRKHERATGDIVGCNIEHQCFEVLDPSKRVGLAEGKLKTSARAARRSMRVASGTPNEGLTPEELAMRDHIVRRSGAMRIAYEAEKRRLLTAPVPD